MTVNHVLMHFRRPIVRSERTTEDGSLPIQIANGTANPGKMAVLDHISLVEAIKQLPQGYRTVFILHDVEGYEHEEIAKILGCAPGTSKSQLHKARLKLRAILCDQNAPKKKIFEMSRRGGALLRRCPT
jgi:RNA polymerase sigma-70 factor (ECF subfamily)